MVKILLVEDDPLMQRLIQLYLKSFDGEIDAVCNGRIAAKKIKEKMYNILITDLQMPEMDGAALIRNIRKEGNMIPVIILSSYDKEQVEELINDENVVSLRKPFESVDLIKKINSLLLDDMH